MDIFSISSHHRVAHQVFYPLGFHLGGINPELLTSQKLFRGQVSRSSGDQGTWAVMPIGMVKHILSTRAFHGEDNAASFVVGLVCDAKDRDFECVHGEINI
jgi:hypothetical protein